METKPSCFVIIGYGKKTSYANGKVRVLDLDETYTTLIKPVFDALNIPCYRAIDKNINGSIDKLMLEEIRDAHIALADISTLNANVMWELGVRHALKPRHTIMICEKEQMSSIPFDINHFIVHQYTHTDEGIPAKIIQPFKDELTRVVKAILDNEGPETDSPVHTFLEKELHSTKEMVKKMDAPAAEETSPESFSTVMAAAEEAKKNKDFLKAIKLFNQAREAAGKNMTLKDNLPLIISRLALCTYKLKEPNELEALVRAKSILDELNPTQSQDIEVLGLSGAISKRLNEITGDDRYLESAIQSYEKGFLMKNDYYNGINACFMLYKKAARVKKQNGEWEDIKLKADYYRNSVLAICHALESQGNFNESADAVWVLNTLAEGYHYKDNPVKATEYEALAAAKKDSFAMSSYEEQRQKAMPIFEELKS